ncbi:MAG TPA: 3-deoxy-7-phosphoheptulonate synthase [Polyangiales bacterium]|nr:3-deoxy-7-phosphoheptulonate synthase [Polyangiales bacterium]
MEHASAGEEPLPSPAQLRHDLPATPGMLEAVFGARAAIRDILHGRDERLLVVVGPCSIHDLAAAREYAHALLPLQARHRGELLLCMRTYFEKPRTRVGWKGMLNDPHLDGSCDVTAGLRMARSLLLELAALGLPTAIEALDPLAPRYFAKLVSWSAIGARTTESQTHRELASGLGMPVGFKNGTDGGIAIALHAIEAAARAHASLGFGDDGRPCVLRTRGNPHAHLVLRGGASGPNYTRSDVTRAVAQLHAAGLPPRVMVDCSHDNCARDHENQARVVDSLAEQIAHGSDAILGAMIESHLVAGKQARAVVYGQSITDACVDLATTERLLDTLAQAVRTRKLRLRASRRSRSAIA